MDRRRALGLAARHVALSWGALVLGAVLVAAGLLSAAGGALGLVNAVRDGGAAGLLDALGTTGVVLVVVGVLVAVLGRVAALHYVVTRTVRAALDEEVARIERELAREVRGIRKSAGGEDVAGRLDALEREVERLRTAEHRGPATTQDAASEPAAGRTDPVQSEGEPDEEATARPPEQRASGATTAPPGDDSRTTATGDEDPGASPPRSDDGAPNGDAGRGDDDAVDGDAASRDDAGDERGRADEAANGSRDG